MTVETGLTILVVNAALSFAAIPLYIRTAKERNIVDVPNERSSHATPTPRGGGIFVAAGCLLSIAVAGFFTKGAAWVEWTTLLASGTLIALIGFVDDIKNLSSHLRLSGHFLAAVLLIIAATIAKPEETAGVSLPLLSVGLAGLAIWIVGCLNIYNFMDGIDGIATGQGLTAAIGWLAIAHSTNSPIASTIAAALLGGLLAFLFFNWSPAKVFMGDGASGFLGFSFATLPILVAAPTPFEIWLNINLGALILFPFLFDGTFTLSRRAHALLIEDGRLNIRKLTTLVELTQAHRSHLYQRWVQAGASHQTVALAYTGWAAVSGGAALLVHFGQFNLLFAWSIALLPAMALLWHSKKFPSA